MKTKFFYTLIVMFFALTSFGYAIAEDQPQQRSVLSEEDKQILNSYLKILNDIKNLYDEIKKTNVSVSITETKKNEPKKIEQTNVKEQKNEQKNENEQNLILTSNQNPNKTENNPNQNKTEKPVVKPSEMPVNKDALITKKYSVGLILPLFEKDLKNLMTHKQAKAVFYEDNTVEITDNVEGHQKISEYINKVKERFARIYRYHLNINGDEFQFSGMLSPILPASFGTNGTIECMPKDDYLIVKISDLTMGISQVFMLPQTGGTYNAVNNKVTFSFTLTPANPYEENSKPFSLQQKENKIQTSNLQNKSLNMILNIRNSEE